MVFYYAHALVDRVGNIKTATLAEHQNPNQLFPYEMSRRVLVLQLAPFSVHFLPRKTCISYD